MHSRIFLPIQFIFTEALGKDLLYFEIAFFTFIQQMAVDFIAAENSVSFLNKILTDDTFA